MIFTLKVGMFGLIIGCVAGILFLRLYYKSCVEYDRLHNKIDEIVDKLVEHLIVLEQYSKQIKKLADDNKDGSNDGDNKDESKYNKDESNDGDNKDESKYNKDTGTLNFGKYAHLTPQELIKKDIKYARWMCSVTSDNKDVQVTQKTLFELLPPIKRPKNGSSCLKFVEWLAATKPKPIQDYLDAVSKLTPHQVTDMLKVNITNPLAFGRYIDAKLKGLSTDNSYDSYNIDISPALSFVKSFGYQRFDVAVNIKHQGTLIMKGIADMVVDNTIYEFKTGNNSFSAYSWIQVLLYAIGLDLTRVRIYNPITGQLASYTITSDVVCGVRNILCST